MSDQLLELETTVQGITTLTLNRPDKHNAFDPQLMQLIIETLLQLQNDPDCRVLIITGKGKSFSSGADLNYMKSMVNYSHAENVTDAHRLATMLQTLNHFPKPVIAAVNGNAFAGATGLIAASDIVIAASNARFCISEVRLGIAPAVISPYVVARIGIHHARRYFLTAEVFGAEAAQRAGLVHEIVEPDQLLSSAKAFAATFLNNGPHAISATKELIHRIAPALVDSDTTAFTCELIATLRCSKEGQQGLAAYFAKAAPPWAGVSADSAAGPSEGEKS
jgi:methylglutaconyl-CoA hydratase